MILKPGNYRLRNGQIGHIWEKRIDEEEGVLWVGTVTDGGVETWDSQGRDKYGDADWDIVAWIPEIRIAK